MPATCTSKVHQQKFSHVKKIHHDLSIVKTLPLYHTVLAKEACLCGLLMAEINCYFLLTISRALPTVGPVVCPTDRKMSEQPIRTGWTLWMRDTSTTVSVACIIVACKSSVALRPRRPYGLLYLGRGAQDVHLDLFTQLLSFEVMLPQCCFTSRETVRSVRDSKDYKYYAFIIFGDREPRTATSTSGHTAPEL